ncbi:MAG: hypothetical protein HY842_16650 [Bacteroidetes bacterium]|nr:hypothetical protein [Bacteroidota bacterium]
MKNARKKTIVFSAIGLVVVMLSNCKLDDQILGNDVTTTNALVSQKVATAPNIDGAIDAIWANSPKFEFEAVVPDPSGDIFRGYVGNITSSITLRSMYDANNIYFLAEWIDPTESLIREPWYFDPTTKTWAQEKGAPTFSATGAITRGAFYEDKLAMLWNVNNSVSGWNNATCYKSCHTGLSAADGFGRHHTNSSTEKIDMWHWKVVRTGFPNGQFDDQYQDNTYANGRKSDDKTGGGYTDNKQTLVITGTATSVTVPKYVIPNATNYYWILQSEIDGGTAKLITAVDANGVLAYEGGTIDPNTDVAFQRDGAGVGAKVIPGIYTAPFVGSRGDITCSAVHTGEGWVLEFSRALKTDDVVNQDVDFSSLEDQYFGVGIFENAQIAHSIKANLLLKFQK